MRRKLEDYRKIVGDEFISEVYRLARPLYRKHVLHINSTYQGGGVAEILTSLVSLMNDIGLDAGWRILHGNHDFFTITKKFHNGLQGEEINLSKIKQHIYTQTNATFSVFTHIDHDCVIVHDPQPLPLITYYKKRQPWIWRCHIDLSHPQTNLWDYLKSFLLQYDGVVVSKDTYLRGDLPVEQHIISPAIDPLTSKNKEVNDGIIPKILKQFNIPTDKPLITQISRFDKWKDPLGVLKVFRMVKKSVDCRLVLCGSMAPDDPEGLNLYERVKETAMQDIQKGDVILITVENDLLVNVLQRVSSVIIQKSIREGFGLTVTEALWKGTPVVASNIGGIPLQIKDKETGFLLKPNDLKGFTDRICTILKDPTMAKKLGHQGKEYVRKHFLITRLLKDYLMLLKAYLVYPSPYHRQ